MKQPLVTVLTTTYNHERFIGPCIESVVSQTYPDWEMIVMDDGSTDRTGDIAASYSDPRVHYHRMPHRGIAGLAERYRFGLSRARGDLVAILAGDDAWPAWRLEQQVPRFAEKDVVLCFGQGVLIDEAGREIAALRMPPAPNGIVNRPIGSALRRLLVANYIPSYAALLLREALDRIGGYVQPPGVTGVDSPTLLHLALEGEFRYVDMPLGYWRVHGAQHTGLHRREQARTDADYALSFFRGLDHHMQRRSGWTEPRLAAELRRRLRNVDFEIGRRKLLAGERREARQLFLTAMVQGSLQTKGKAIVGLACALTGADLERIARRTGRVPLR